MSTRLWYNCLLGCILACIIGRHVNIIISHFCVHAPVPTFFLVDEGGLNPYSHRGSAMTLAGSPLGGRCETSPRPQPCAAAATRSHGSGVPLLFQAQIRYPLGALSPSGLVSSPLVRCAKRSTPAAALPLPPSRYHARAPRV
jgi:hypothetical protein